MGVIIFNGISSASIPIGSGQEPETISVHVEHAPGYEFPERDYDVVHVLGRNGDLLIDRGSFKNKPRKYEISFGALNGSFDEKASAISSWLHSAEGYSRLEDSYDVDHYRMAYYIDSVDVENILAQGGRAEIQFLCKPQRFLNSGDEVEAISSPSGIILNPTRFEAMPMIVVSGTNNGSGTISINNQVLTINNITDGMVLDCETQDAYHGDQSLNRYVSGDYPLIPAGEWEVGITGDITSINITPRWWTL